MQAELMLFGLMSLLMGHWIGYVAKLCVKSTALSTRFYPCSLNNGSRKYTFVSSLELLINNTVVREEEMSNKRHDYCPKVMVFMDVGFCLLCVCKNIVLLSS